MADKGEHKFSKWQSCGSWNTPEHPAATNLGKYSTYPAQFHYCYRTFILRCDQTPPHSDAAYSTTPNRRADK